MVSNSSSIAPSGHPERGRPMTNVELAESVCSVSAPLFEARRLHLHAYGCLIPHVFMGDVLKRIGECLAARTAAGRAIDSTEVQGILNALERGMVDGERETRNVIAMSFARDSELEIFFKDLQSLMGPRTRAQLHGK